MMESCEIVYQALDQMEIPYVVLEHPAVWTAEEADRCLGDREGARIKCLFLSDQKSKQFHLVAMDSQKRLDIKKLCILTREKHMKFCSPQRLMDKMALVPGMVSVFGLLNNHEHDIQVWLDGEILHQGDVMFHPNDNTKTLFFSADDLLRFLQEAGYEYQIIEI